MVKITNKCAEDNHSPNVYMKVKWPTKKSPGCTRARERNTHWNQRERTLRRLSTQSASSCSTGPSGAPNLEWSTFAMPTSSRSRSPSGDDSHGGQGGRGQHLHGPLPIPAKAPCIAGVAEKKSPLHEGFQRGGGKNPILFRVGLLQLRAKSSRSTNLHQEEKSVVLPQLADSSVHWQSQAGQKRTASLVRAGEELHCSWGTGGGKGHLHCQDRPLGQTFCL